MRPEAVVLAVSQRQMLVRLASDIEFASIGEYLFVTIRRSVPHHQPIARFDLSAAYFRVLHRGSHRMRNGAGPAQDFLDGRTEQRTLVSQPSHLIGILNQFQ